MKKYFVMLAFILTFLSGCSSVALDDEKYIEPTEKVNYTVSFESNGASVIDPLTVEEGMTITVPTKLEKTGYVFGGWFTDEAFQNQFSETSTVESDLTLYALWNPLSSTVNVYFEDSLLGRFTAYYDYESELSIMQYDYYEFLGWYSDKDYNNEITSVTGTLEDQSIYLRLELKDFDLEEEAIDLTTLPYYSYLKETNPRVTITVKDVGVMELELFPDLAKNTVDNLIRYIEDEAYSGSTLHRVIEDFMIQGGIVDSTYCSINGDFSSNGFENDLSHFRGVLSMARTSVMNSATSQFFIVHKDSDFLDGNYATFGGLVSGFTVLDYIAGIDTTSSDAPLLDIVIEDITVDLNGYEVASVVCSE